ncbi:group II intron reverse transcriptase/maturase [Enterococcus faecium]|uniref:group II intron reverse transcriptase/maturase n=1 Tax=Enterococcus TaxID=1350 RepID=UPI0002F49B72|nr:group II intron reverse transcriptase/maturase [Enterococcus faecium]HAQ1583693.1 group II intron reverse transcriptase/maturase [Enterococcus faecium Efm-HS0661]MBY3588161.1 group II intron reverse transcriptase/maturase [Enterococcus faecium]MBY3632946.1 group II intron reverse transcriptase/maturase [Enterococcus faecium]MCU1989252.1 group II intron reverse transcriptase/maturase [Enterococcus faecium]MCU1992137.1 group II intron reverse transcriptase/maturase [Enterococcus faecium]
MENVSASHSIRHMEYYGMIDSFDNLYKESSDNHVFNNLMEIVTSSNNILLAYRNVKGNSGSVSPGVDNKNIDDLKEIPNADFIKIVQTKFSEYKPQPVKRVEIPKPNGKTRPLGIPTIWDRIVQQCLLQVLEPIMEAKFHDKNYGFRPNRSAHHAFAQAVRLAQVSKLTFVVDIDIEGFFDNVNHSKLIKQLWTLGVQDKWLLGVIRAMLKAPIIHKDGRIEHPKKGTPQGGILSPLLANVVLNELDWWISSQWETHPTRHNYDWYHAEKGYWNKGNKYRALRGSKLKEIYIVRYADDFKIFCRKRSDADNIFIAAKSWLKERLKLDISIEKSKVVNLKKQKSEFLGFTMKLVRKRKTFVIETHMCHKAMKKVSDNLAKQIKVIQHTPTKEELQKQLVKYNSMVIGIHQYYKKATHISVDCPKINQRIMIIIKNRLDVKKNGHPPSDFVKKNYARSKQLRWINGYPMIPLGFVKHSHTSLPKMGICKYTPEGRVLIHKYLTFPIDIINQLMNMNNPDESIEFRDNRVSKYSSQRGRCRVTKEFLELADIYCHRIIPKKLGGKDNFQNLVIIHRNIHQLIHENDKARATLLVMEMRITGTQLEIINQFRKKAKNCELSLNL